MKNFTNLTPHDIVLNDGTIYPKTGQIARVKASYEPFDDDKITKQSFGEVEWLPEKMENIMYIVSALVLSALQWIREDVVAPATGHPDVKRNEQGQIVSVPGFTR